VCSICVNPLKSAAKGFSKNKCGPGQPPEPHRSWISCPAIPPLGAASRCTGPTALTRSATFTSTGRSCAIRRTSALQPLRRPAAQPAPRADCRGGRNARATGLRSRAFPISPGNSPSRIAGCHRRHRKSSFGKLLRIATFSLNPLSGRTLRSATKKLCTIVQKLWTIVLPCGKLRKTAQDSRPDKCRPRLFNNLDAVKK
jgi:hypothetical protein